MGILSFLMGKSDKPKGAENRSMFRDERKAECPYCNKALKQVPGAKTKCPHCGKFMFVRTKPRGNVRVVVTEAEAEKIEEDWTIVTGTHDAYVAEKEAIKKERESLKEKFGKEPSENDVKWSLLNKNLLEHAQHQDWGLYRNTRFEMAEILRREMRFNPALNTYLEVCYLDLNGPINRGGFLDSSDKNLLAEFPAFDPNNFADLAPGVINLIKRVNEKLKLPKEELKKLFIEHNLRVEKSLRLPVSPERCWTQLEKEL